MKNNLREKRKRKKGVFFLKNCSDSSDSSDSSAQMVLPCFACTLNTCVFNIFWSPCCHLTIICKWDKGKRPTMIKDFINMYVWFSSVFHLIFLTSAVVSYFIHNEFLQIIASNIACSSVWTKWIRWRMNSDIGFVQAWCNDDRNSTYHKLIWR